MARPSVLNGLFCSTNDCDCDCECGCGCAGSNLEVVVADVGVVMMKGMSRVRHW
jgi:hypothetical protein